MTANKANLALPFVASMGQEIDLVEKATKEVLKRGIIKSKPYLFDRYSGYYRDEMGEGLYKILYVESSLVELHSLLDLKKMCMEIEKGYEREGKRRVNLDAGLLTLGSLLLASRKVAYHRTPLGRDLYVEVTLIYERGDFIALPWTYPDYKTKEVKGFLKIARERLKKLRRERG